MALINENNEDYYDGSGADFGSYQFTTLANIIDAFEVIYVGEGKLISKASRTEIAFHAQRALQELSFDTLKSVKSQEIEVPNSLQMTLPQDYVNYVKITRVDDDGIERILYPTRHTSNPRAISQAANGDYNFDGSGNLQYQTESNTWEKFKALPAVNNDDDSYDTDLYEILLGQRYGISPEHSQVNGSFYIDEHAGKIHFSSVSSGKTIVLKYISDGLGTEDEMRVHKFAEEAMYKHISYAILSAKANIPPVILERVKKEKRATTRQAKLRLSNFKLEEFAQVLRGKSKQIKH